MRFHSRFGTLIFGNILFFIFTTPVLAVSSDILLSEFQIESVDQNGKTESKDEFVELYNTTDHVLSLKNYKLVRKTSTGTTSSLRSSFKETDTIPAKGFYLLVNKDASLSLLSIKDNEFVSAGTLAADNSLALLDKDDIPLDSIAWGKSTLFTPDTSLFPNPGKNTSLTRDTTTLTWVTTSIPTPTNSSGVTWATTQPDPMPIPSPTLPPIPDPTPPPSLPVAIRINEILPDPSAKGDAGEFIELYNFGTESVDVSGWNILDAAAIKKTSDGKTLSKNDKLAFPDGTIIHSGGYLIVTDTNSWFSLTLNNSNETLSLFDASGTLIDSVQYEKSKEGVSQNRVGSTLRGGTPTPGQPNQPNTLPETKERVPKKGYREVTVAFDARGKDADGGKLKYTWDFGDGHKSYKEETTHKYSENGAYSVTLTTTDGSDDITETFTIKIESLPKPEVRITALSPNPSGRDSDAEWLLIENREKKPVDLKGYSIATGWKKLVNHPVRESFVIAPKSQATLTRNFSLFTLPNQKGKIELRAPDGTVLQDITYKLEKSATEDAVYFKEKGKRWAWKEEVTKTVAPLKTTTNQSDDELPEQTESTEKIPEEITDTTIPTEIEASINPERVLGATTKVIADQKYLSLLNYGTGVNIPENIHLSFPEPNINEPLPERDHYAISFAKVIFENINTALNAVQNKSWGGQAL